MQAGLQDSNFRSSILSNLATFSRASTLRHALAASWIVALYFLCNPYRGVRHDAVLYFGQMQFHLTPEWLRHDLFFLFDSQDRYSLFSTIFAPVLHALGLSSAEMVILLVLHALLLLATWQLTAGLPTASRWGALALMLALPRFYSSDQRFAFAEPFLTARTLAEPFAVIALAWLLRGRVMLALVAAGCAVVSHPLIALPALLIGWRLLCAQDRRWNWAASLALPVGVLAWLQVGPFAGLARVYDAEWLAMANKFVFMTAWPLSAWAHVIFDAVVLWLCARDASLPWGRLARATLVVTIGCLVVSVIGVDWLHDILLTQLQLWRVLWITHLVALLSLAPLVANWWRQGGKGRLAVFAVLMGAITVGSTLYTGWVAGLVAFAAVGLAQSRAVISKTVVRIGIAACIVATIVVSILVAMSQLDQLAHVEDYGILIGRTSAVPTTLSALVLLVALPGLWPLVRPGRMATACSAACVAVLLVAGISQWDQRSDWSRYVEHNQGKPHPFQALIPPDRTVYWPDDLLATWAVLGRSAFYDVRQVSGAVFSRETSAAGKARRDAVNPLIIQSKICRALVATGLTTTTLEDCKPTLAAVHDVCHLSDLHPDFLVLNSPIESPPLATWTHVSADGSEPEGHFLYACSRIP
jgi:hypothetical protein